MTDLRSKYLDVRTLLTKVSSYPTSGSHHATYKLDSDLKTAGEILAGLVTSRLEAGEAETKPSEIMKDKSSKSDNYRAPWIVENNDEILSRAWGLCHEYFDIVGKRPPDWLAYLERIKLRDTQERLEKGFEKLFIGGRNPATEEITVVQNLIRVLIRLGEMKYHGNDFEHSHNIYNQLQTALFRHFLVNEKYFSLLMNSLTENTVLDLYDRFGRPLASAGPLAGAEASRLTAEIRLARELPPEADEFLYLLCQISFCLGRSLMRRSAFRLAERPLGDAMKAIDMWRRIRLVRLGQDKSDSAAAEIQYVNNYALLKTALIQATIAFSEYRKGTFSRATSLVAPARLVLRNSNWLWPKIYADEIYSGGNRRLGGLNNPDLLAEVSFLNKQIIGFFSLLRRQEGVSNGDSRDFAFKLRALYEQGTCFFYAAEVLENSAIQALKRKVDVSGTETMIPDPETVFARILLKLRQAGNHARKIQKHFQVFSFRDVNDRNFWLANAEHLLSFVEMKRAVLKMKLVETIGRLTEDKETEIKDHFTRAKALIDSAVDKSALTNSWWQRTEAQTDKCFILNEFARFYTFRNRFIKADPEYRRALAKKLPATSDEDEEVISANLAKQNKIKNERLSLINESLQSAEIAWKYAMEMALAEVTIAKDLNPAAQLPELADVRPRPHFAGAISLVKSEALALAGQKNKSEEAFNDWKSVAYNVEYTRVRDISRRIEKEIETVQNAFILYPDIDGDLNYKTQEFELRKWLFANARIGVKDGPANERLGLPHATFYKWKREIDELEIELRDQNDEQKKSGSKH